MCDQGALESALARPVNEWTYGEDDLCAQAAAYAFGIARNHAFADGDKRTAWVFARLFLRLNGQSLSFPPREAIDIVVALAGGELSEAELPDWFRERLALALFVIPANAGTQSGLALGCPRFPLPRE
ncbi:type II toxin-antitoxin system death-on-curing family toxin [Pontixanthobacter aestiaquae]|uniref:type II toxin-antitoxin system death-on-curing family toxin n=1 Tax=Pontixanthobacter aestiaquae TaxID=1509367 RepID=UPI002E263F20|nr:type II toxin-antitoxin system death-on-curing family toxin [Pontixanthobacter aestiaquae]